MGIRTRCPKCAGHGSVWVSLFKGFKKCEYCYGPAGHTMVDFHISPNGEVNYPTLKLLGFHDAIIMKIGFKVPMDNYKTYGSLVSVDDGSYQSSTRVYVYCSLVSGDADAHGGVSVRTIESGMGYVYMSRSGGRGSREQSVKM